MPDFIIRDFQAIKEAKLSVKGFTLLIGESSAGKSACLRAIYAATFNRFKIGQIRNGCDHTIIKVRYDDKEDILQVRRNETGSPIAKLGDDLFSKMNRTLPKQIEEFNNFGTLEVGDSKYSLNFHFQFQKPLLLEFSQKKVMEILSASHGLDDLNIVHYSLSELRQQNRGAFKQVSAILDENNAKKSVLSYDLSQVTELNKSLNVLLKDIEDCPVKLSSLDELILCISNVCKLHSKLKYLEELNVLTISIQNNSISLTAVNSLLKLIEESYNLGKYYSTLSEFKKIYESTNTSELTSAELLVHDINDVQLLSEKMTLLSKVNSLSKNSYDIDIKKSEELISRVLTLQSANISLDELISFNTVAYAGNKLKSLIDKDLSQLDSIKFLLSCLDSLHVLNNKVVELNDILNNHICPICKHKL